MFQKKKKDSILIHLAYRIKPTLTVLLEAQGSCFQAVADWEHKLMGE